MQLLLFNTETTRIVKPFRAQLLKWVGNKQRFAHEIISSFPGKFGTYFEPFLGTGAVLATLVPQNALGSDTCKPLMEIWQTLKESPETIKRWYSERWHIMMSRDKVKGYNQIRDTYNAKPNGADLLFLSRSCYGGVIRFRQADGYISTPCGIHTPISPKEFARRVDGWHHRIAKVTFALMEYEEAMEMANPGDLIYCDPPYSFSQSILYGGQTFSLENLLRIISRCKSREVYVVLSIDGTKRSGNMICNLPIPNDLFKREILVNCGRSMLKRFQMNGKTLETELVADRLLLTY